MLWIRITLLRIWIRLITRMWIQIKIFYLMRIRIRLFTLMGIRTRIQILALKKAQTLEKVLNRLIFQFRIQLINFDADMDFYLMRIWIQVTKMMRIRIYNTAKTYGSGSGTLMNPVHYIFTWKTSALMSMVLLTPKLLPTGKRGGKKTNPS